MDAVVRAGGTPFIPFKANTVAPVEDSAWARMYHLFAYGRETFLRHYHKRSNVETVMSMLKGKFGDSLLSKNDNGQMNEVLAKVLAHNICVVIGAIHELGVAPTFGLGWLASRGPRVRREEPMLQRVVAVALAGGLTLGLGVAVMAEKVGVTPSDSADTIFPGLLIGVGVALLVIARRT